MLRHLRSCLGRPTIPEMTEHLNRYFRQGRRKRYETMNSYITRKLDTYHRARQAMFSIQPRYERRNHGTNRWRDWDWYRGNWSWGDWRQDQHDANESQAQQEEHDQWFDAEADSQPQDYARSYQGPVTTIPVKMNTGNCTLTSFYRNFCKLGICWLTQG